MNNRLLSAIWPPLLENIEILYDLSRLIFHIPELQYQNPELHRQFLFFHE